MNYAQIDLSQSFRNITDAVVVIDRQWQLVYLNNKAHRLFSPQSRIAIGESMWSVKADWLGPNFYRQLQKSVQANEIITFQRLNPDLGQWFEVRCFPNPDGLLMLLRDISEYKQKTEQVAKEQSRTADIIRGLPGGFLVVDKETGIIIINRAAQIYLGIKHQPDPGERIADISPYGEKLSINLYNVQVRRAPVQFEIADPAANICLQFEAYPVGEHQIAVYIQDAAEERQLEGQEVG